MRTFISFIIFSVAITACTTHSVEKVTERNSNDSIEDKVFIDSTQQIQVIEFGYNHHKEFIPSDSNSTVIDTLGYNIRLNGEFYTQWQNDSVFISEELGYTLSGRLLNIETQQGKPVQVEFMLHYELLIQWNYELFSSKGRNHEYWQSIQEFYSGSTQKRKLQDSAYFFFRIPFISDDLTEISLKKQQLNLGDTLVVLHKESYTDSAAYLCDGWPCTLWVRNSVFSVSAPGLPPIHLVFVYNYTC